MGLLFRAEVIPFLKHDEVRSVIARKAVTRLNIFPKHNLTRLNPWANKESDASLCRQFNSFPFQRLMKSSLTVWSPCARVFVKRWGLKGILHPTKWPFVCQLLAPCYVEFLKKTGFPAGLHGEQFHTRIWSFFSCLYSSACSFNPRAWFFEFTSVFFSQARKQIFSRLHGNMGWFIQIRQNMFSIFGSSNWCHT